MARLYVFHVSKTPSHKTVVLCAVNLPEHYHGRIIARELILRKINLLPVSKIKFMNLLILNVTFKIEFDIQD